MPGTLVSVSSMNLKSKYLFSRSIGTKVGKSKVLHFANKGKSPEFEPEQMLRLFPILSNFSSVLDH